MKQDIVDAVIGSLRAPEAVDGDSVLFRGVKHKPLALSKERFKCVRPASDDSPLAFIDGGNQEILKSPSSSLQFIRTYCTVYKHNKRVSSKKHEFYVLITTGNEHSVSVRFFDTDLFTGNLTFSLSEFDSEANLSTVGNLIRRLAELKAANAVCNDIPGGFIILDGALYTPNTKEMDIMTALSKEAFESKVTLAAISKTSNLVTKAGSAIATAITAILPQDVDAPWYYHPVAELDDPRYLSSPALALLHAASSHLFLIDIADAERLPVLLSLLAENSTDPVFRGYPYGLIEADRFARVSDKEASQMKTLLLAKSGKDWKRIKDAESPLNAHGILDNIL